LGIVEVRGKINAVHDGADAGLLRLELQFKPADRDRLLTYRPKVSGNQISVLCEDALHHFTAAVCLLPHARSG
ncbi:MAG: hypothetical protein V3U43_00475, partial [Pseudomonadales bacterium]